MWANPERQRLHQPLYIRSCSCPAKSTHNARTGPLRHGAATELATGAMTVAPLRCQEGEAAPRSVGSGEGADGPGAPGGKTGDGTRGCGSGVAATHRATDRCSINTRLRGEVMFLSCGAEKTPNAVTEFSQQVASPVLPPPRRGTRSTRLLENHIIITPMRKERPRKPILRGDVRACNDTRTPSRQNDHGPLRYAVVVLVLY